MNKENPILKKLISLDLPVDDYAVFGSGPMFAYGIKDLGHDIDIIARNKAWDKAKTFDQSKESIMGGSVITLFNGEIEIFDSWAPGEWNTDELIDTAELIEGIRFVTLENVLKWKKIMNREKDLEHIKMIEEYLSNR